MIIIDYFVIIYKIKENFWYVLRTDIVNNVTVIRVATLTYSFERQLEKSI